MPVCECVWFIRARARADRLRSFLSVVKMTFPRVDISARIVIAVIVIIGASGVEIVDDEINGESLEGKVNLN